MTTANQLHEVTVDGQTYIIKRSPCLGGHYSIFSGRREKQCGQCPRWRPAWNQGYQQGSKSHTFMMCVCRDCGHGKFVPEEWLKGDAFLTTHRDYLRLQSENKARSYGRSFQHYWAEPLHETVKLVIDDLDAGDLEEAKIKLTAITEKIEGHKRDHLAVEGYDPT